METSTLLQLIRETCDVIGCHEFGVSTDAATTSLTIADYPAQTNRTNASNRTYEGNELRLADAQGSSTIVTTDMSATATSVVVASGSSFAASSTRPYVIAIDSELMLATLSSATFTILSGSRGWGGTRAAIHPIGATVYGPARTPNPVSIGAYVASTGVLTPSVTWTADPGTVLAYDIFFQGVSYFDALMAVNQALREIRQRSKFILSLLPDGDMALGGISNWTASASATVSKVTNTNAIRGPRSLRVLAGAANQYAQSGTLLVDPTNQPSWFAQALVRAQVGTATLLPYDVTNSANITVSGTQTWTAQGWGIISINFTLPATCESLAFRLESTANNDDTYWQYVAPYPNGARQLSLPSWVERSTQIVRPMVDLYWTSLRADTPEWWPIGGDVEEDLSNPNNQTRLILHQPLSQPIWLDAYRRAEPLIGDAQTAYVERELVVWCAAYHLADKMARSSSGPAKIRWLEIYTDARKQARRISRQIEPAQEVVLG